MPPKRFKKRGKKSPSLLLAEQHLAQARVDIEKRVHALAAEEKRLQTDTMIFGEREATLVLREEANKSVEVDVTAREESVKERHTFLDTEVSQRSRATMAASEAREAGALSRIADREAECAAREARYADAESALAIRSVEVGAREAAVGDAVVGGLAERLNKLLMEQAEGRDREMTKHSTRLAAEAELTAREARLEAKVAHARADVAEMEHAAGAKVAGLERKLTATDFAQKRRLARRVKEAEAIVAAHRAECHIRDRRLTSREEDVNRRHRELISLMRKLRKYEQQLKSGAGEDAPDATFRPWLPLRNTTPGTPGRSSPQSPASPSERDARAGPGTEARTPAHRRPESDMLVLSLETPYREHEQSYDKRSRGLYREPPNAGAAKVAAAAAKTPEAFNTGSFKLPGANDTDGQFQQLISYVHGMETELVEELHRFQENDAGGSEDEVAVVENALRDVQAAERLVLCAEGLTNPEKHARPHANPADGKVSQASYAARRLPERPSSARSERPSTAQSERPSSASASAERSSAGTRLEARLASRPNSARRSATSPRTPDAWATANEPEPALEPTPRLETSQECE